MARCAKEKLGYTALDYEGEPPAEPVLFETEGVTVQVPDPKILHTTDLELPQWTSAAFHLKPTP